MQYLHSISYDASDNPTALSIFPEDGSPVVATTSNVEFDRAVALVKAGKYEEAIEALNPSQTITSALQRFKDKVLRRGEERLAKDIVIDRTGVVRIDGEPADPALSATIIRYYKEGSRENFEPLVRFLHNIAANPNEHSREQLYRWLDHQSFTITQDGCFIGYKSVAKHGGRFVSHTASRPGDNVVVNGNRVPDGEAVPNPIGAVVSMPRETVNHNPAVGCSTGLHVGTWDYASSFRNHNAYILSVKVNPADVASVPTDCNAEKVRCSRYEVITVTAKERVRALSRIGETA